jgi:hypothetical protein
VQPLHPAVVTLRDGGGRTRTSRAAWPSFAVASRLTEAEIAFSTPRAPTLAVAPVTWRITPATVGWLAVAAAGLLLLGAGWLVASVLAADAHPLRARRIPAHLTAIDRALALAEYAAARGEVDESRKALERLAAELRRRRGFAHADDAERLAWSEHGPSARTVAELATSVRSNGAR